jgi:hypothetical protein
MAPQFVKPYVKTNKNDIADAEAILARRWADPTCAYGICVDPFIKRVENGVLVDFFCDRGDGFFFFSGGVVRRP